MNDSIVPSARAAIAEAAESGEFIGPQGPQGAAGNDGVSPDVVITNIAGGHRLTITDAAYPAGQSFDVLDGGGSGDMMAKTYDSDSTVASAGGIAAYVQSVFSTIVDGNGVSY